MSALFYETGDSPAIAIQRALQTLRFPDIKPQVVFWAGNGGCAAISDHMATELMTGFGTRSKCLPSISLASNPSLLTAIANDFGADVIFSHQVSTLVSSEDLVILLSTSGESENLITAAAAARTKAARLLSIVGQRVDERPSLSMISDASVIVRSPSAAAIQEHMLSLAHEVCSALLENDPI